MAGAGLPRDEHAGRAPDGRQVEILRLAGAHPDLVPQGVVDHGVAVLAGKDGPLGEGSVRCNPGPSITKLFPAPKGSLCLAGISLLTPAFLFLPRNNTSFIIYILQQTAVKSERVNLPF